MKYLKISGLTICLLFQVGAYAQPEKFPDIKAHIDSIPLDTEYFDNIDSLDLVILIEDWSELEKAFGLYYWMSKNIQYDLSPVDSKTENSYEEVALLTYKEKKGQCWELSCLYKYLCKKVDIKAEIIVGVARTDYHQLLDEPIFTSKNALHSWNAIYVDNHWKLVDPTNIGDKVLIDYFFDVNPNNLHFTHFPEEPYWQLTDKLIDSTKFNILPYYSPLFFYYGFDCVFPESGLIKVEKNGTFIVKLGHSMDYRLRPGIYDLEKRIWSIPEYTIHSSCKETEIYFHMDEKGRFLLRIDFIRDEGEETIREKGILVYVVDYRF